MTRTGKLAVLATSLFALNSCTKNKQTLECITVTEASTGKIAFEGYGSLVNYPKEEDFRVYSPEAGIQLFNKEQYSYEVDTAKTEIKNTNSGLFSPLLNAYD